MVRDGIRFPSVIHFYPTMRCPLNCSYCYVEEVNKDRKELTLETYYRLVEEGIGLGARTFDIAGGEPFVWPHLISLLKAIKAQSAESKVVTSGLLLDKHSDAFDRERTLISELHVSIDSADSKLHDETRGYKGLHDKVVANIKHYVKEQFGPVKINYVLQRGTYAGFESMLDFTASLGLQGIDVQCMVDVSSKTKGQNYALDPHEILEAFETIMNWLERHSPDDFHILFVAPAYMLPLFSRHESSARKKPSFQQIYFPGMRGSGAFQDAMFIKHNGEVTGSTTLINNDRWFIGNVASNSLKEIWETGAEPMLSSILDRSRELLGHGVCADCLVKRFCQGGDPEIFRTVELERHCSLKEQLRNLIEC